MLVDTGTGGASYVARHDDFCSMAISLHALNGFSIAKVGDWKCNAV